MGSKPSQPTVEQKEEVERKEVDRIQEIQNVVSNIETILEGNPNLPLPNLIQLFSNVVCVQKPELICFKEIITSMKKNWNKLSKCLDALGIHVSHQDRKMLISLQRDYWGLLLKTRSVIHLLVKKCSIKQRDVRILLNLIETAAQNNGELNKDEISAHRQCVQALGEWIQVSELQTIYNEWQNICGRLQEQQISWKEKVAEFKQSSKNLAMSIVAGIGIVLLSVAVISIVVFSVVAISAATAGVGAPAAATAGGAAVKTITVCGVSVLTTHAECIGISLGVLGVGGVFYGTYKIWKRFDAASQAYKNANKVTTMLAKMIKESMRIGNQMKVLDDKLETDVKTELEYLSDACSRITMKESLLKMDEHLSEYIKQGQQVIKAVNGACKKYIK